MRKVRSIGKTICSAVRPSDFVESENTAEELLSPKLLCFGRLILEAGITSDLLMEFVSGVVDSLKQSPADVLIIKLRRLMQVAEGDIKDKAQQKIDAKRHQESTKIYKEEKRKERAREREAERMLLRREKFEQKLQTSDDDKTG